MAMRAAAARASSITLPSTTDEAAATIASRSPRWPKPPRPPSAERRTARRHGAPPGGSAGCPWPRREWWPAALPGRPSRRLQGGLARLPAARAELAGLKGIEHAEHLIDVPSHREVVHAHEADDALGIDDERRPQGNTLLLVEDAERA